MYGGHLGFGALQNFAQASKKGVIDYLVLNIPKNHNQSSIFGTQSLVTESEILTLLYNVFLWAFCETARDCSMKILSMVLLFLMNPA